MRRTVDFFALLAAEDLNGGWGRFKIAREKWAHDVRGALRSSAPK